MGSSLRFWRVVMLLSTMIVGLAVLARDATQTLSCTDASNTTCTVKKSQAFQITADAVPDITATEKWRLYQDGARVGEQPNTGVAPVFDFPSGLAALGTHVFFMEAIGTAYDLDGTATEIASGPSNTVTLTVVTGSVGAPKNLRIIK
jgi:hypothetical protein